MHKKSLLVSVFACLIAFSSCNINTSIMFKTDKNYPYKIDQTISNVEYKIAVNDILGVSVYTNDGFKLIDLTANSSSVQDKSVGSGNLAGNSYDVDIDGLVKLPIIGRIKILGLTHVHFLLFHKSIQVFSFANNYRRNF